MVSMMGLTDLFITFIIISQFLCGKVRKAPHIFLHKAYSKFHLSLL